METRVSSIEIPGSGGADVSNVTNNTSLCAICYVQAEVLHLCEREDCPSSFCSSCWAAHATATVEAALYAVPKVRCPGCSSRVSTNAWFPLVEDQIRTRYLENARVLLSVRCCGNVSFFQPETSKPEEFDNSSKLQLCTILSQYEGSNQRPEACLEALVSGVFQEDDTGAQAGLPSEALRSAFAPDMIPAWIADPERRVALQLVFLQRYPMICTPCCSTKMCFRCKTYGWHTESCSERQREEMGQRVCFCPHCGVPTVKSEGCDHMLCVCGADWTWGTDPLMMALESRDVSRIEQLLRERSDVNAPLEGSSFSPMDFFLHSVHETSSGTTEIVRTFAKFGAIANPHIHATCLSHSIEEADLGLFKVLLEQFTGVPTLLLTEMLEEVVVTICLRADRTLRMQADPRAAQEQMATMLIDRGAIANHAAQVLYDMPKRRQHKCPATLAHVLKSAFEPHFIEEHFVEAKLTQDHLRCRSHLRSMNRLRSSKQRVRAKLEMRFVRPRGGRCKATEGQPIYPQKVDYDME